MILLLLLVATAEAGKKRLQKSRHDDDFSGSVEIRVLLYVV